MSQLQAIRRFADLVAGEHVIISRSAEGWGSGMFDQHMRVDIPFDLSEEDENDRLFREDFVNRCPLAQEFSDITLSLLHEIGHQFHREEYISFDAKKYNSVTGAEHFKLYPEVVATDWAIEWLQNPEHRKQAKAFEKEFFGYE